MKEELLPELSLLIDKLESAGAEPDSSALQKVGETLARIFGVQLDEVAVLALNSKGQRLSFIIPEKLAVVGSIPLTSPNSLAARTAREHRPELANNFSFSRHASVFEAVPLGRGPDEIIQKIMSAPILNGIKVAGVIQVSRKGVSPAQTGPDFTQKDLRVLVSLSPVLHRFLELCHKT